MYVTHRDTSLTIHVCTCTYRSRAKTNNWPIHLEYLLQYYVYCIVYYRIIQFPNSSPHDDSNTNLYVCPVVWLCTRTISTNRLGVRPELS